MRDEEHNAWALQVDDRTFGYSRTDTLGGALVASAEYRALDAELRRDRRARARAPARWRRRAARGRQGRRTGTDEAPESDEAVTTPETRRGIRGAGRVGPAAGTAAKDAPVRITSLDTFVEHFLTLGRKGVAVDRYKGLGEMNPETLWVDDHEPRRAGRCCRCGPRITPKPTRCSPR